MSSFRLKRHSTSNQQRNSKTPSKTSDRVDTASSSAIRLPFKPFCDPQKRWRSTTSTQPQTFESTYADSTFQNGNYANHHQSPTTRRFFNIHRFARRIPPHTDSPSVSSSTAIPVENTNLSIPCFTFRPQPVSFSVHQSPQTSTEMGSSSRDSDYGISGRSFNHGQFLSTNPTFHSQGMQKNDQFGLVNKYVQVNTDTVAVYPSLRDEHRFQRDDSISSREENPSDPPNGLFTSQASQSQLDQLSPVHRLCTGHTARELSSTFPDSSSFNSVKPFSLPRSFYHQCTDAERATMVDHGNDEMEWTPSIIHPSHNSNIYGRIRPRVWNCLGSTFHPRYMVQTREDSPHQSERIVGDRQSIQIYSFSNQSPSTIMYGQHVSDSVYQTFWGNEILNPEQDCPRYMEILLSELHSAVNFIRPIKIKSSGRAVESPTTSNRMVTTSPNVHSPQSALGPASCRSVCLPDQTSSSSIRHLELPSPSSMDECIQPIVEPPTRTVILSPTVEPSLDDLEKIDTGTSSGDSHNAQLAVCPMVPAGTAVSPISTSPVGNSSQGRKRLRITPTDEESAMDPTSLESSVKRLRLSESALAIINAPSSKKSIPYIQTTFINWCSIRDINHQEHPINSILNFLAEYHALKNWKTSTTLTYASQILQLYPSKEQATIRISEEYVQFCKSLKANTIRPLKTADYDITPALNYLVSLGPTDTLPKDLLTAKTAWLLSMVGFLRPSDVERVDLNQCSVSSDSVLKLVIVAPKEKREGTRITKAVTIHPHENPLLCPVLAYQVYRRRIAQLDALTPHPVFPEVTINALFRNQHDHTIAIGSERISKHVKSVMQFISRPSGTPIPKARALASTLAAQSGISVDDIVVRGNWSSKELFEQFYRISVTTSTDFTRVTLNAQQRSDSSKCNIM